MTIEVKNLRNYGVAFSDAESYWPKSLKKKMARTGRALVFGRLRWVEKIRFLFVFLREKRRVKKVDLSSIQAKGMTNKTFLAQQIEYLSMFSALSQVVGGEQAIQIVKEVMNATAKEAMLLCLPDIEEMKRFDDPLNAWREYLRAAPAACCEAGCFKMSISEDTENAVQFDISWCVWLELAKKMGISEACIPNCYSDELVFPDYFKELGIHYHRTSTLALGARRCDFRFERMK